jgi:hypothetical protein
MNRHHNVNSLIKPNIRVTLCTYIKNYVAAKSSEITQFRVTMETNFRAFSRCMMVSYEVNHERTRSPLFLITKERSPLLVYRVYSVSRDNILMWICEVHFTIDCLCVLFVTYTYGIIRRHRRIIR